MDYMTIMVLFSLFKTAFWMVLAWKVTKSVCGLLNAHEAKADAASQQIMRST